MSEEQDGGSRLRPGEAKALAAESDELLAAMSELRRLEATKREDPITSDAFHEKAARVTEQSRQVYRLASREEHDGIVTRERERERVERGAPPTDDEDPPTIEDISG